MNDLWHERNRIQQERQEFMSQAMEEYDETIYRPAYFALQRKCEAVGHTPGEWHNNGLGRCWRECTLCGKVVEEEYYEL